MQVVECEYCKAHESNEDKREDEFALIGRSDFLQELRVEGGRVKHTDGLDGVLQAVVEVGVIGEENTLAGDVGDGQPLLDGLYETVGALENGLRIAQVNVAVLRQLEERGDFCHQ
jgi:hypothetical protein